PEISPSFDSNNAPTISLCLSLPHKQRQEPSPPLPPCPLDKPLLLRRSMASSAVAPGAGAGGAGRSRDIRLTVQEAAKKLSLWHTATFRPITTHDDLEP
uniref:Uncharacterized protein n=1 Tax=Aegilops tauschii subsp. strangulata TaxID=200361 RepID=A0A453RK70_AEGTS